MSAGDLFERVADEKVGMAEEEARRMFAQMASGVEQMHSRGVAHRDLKLENAVLDADGASRSRLALSRHPACAACRPPVLHFTAFYPYDLLRPHHCRYAPLDRLWVGAPLP